MPRMALRANTADGLPRLTRIGASVLVWFGLPLTVGGVVTAPVVVPWLLGAQFQQAFLIGLAVLKFDLTKLTILVGAFGVGLGFGLQNIITNFVSGLILPFERPIKVGDVIQLGGNEGVVKHIGIRASIVEAPNGSEYIVPNGSLISETVTNWTHSDRLRRLELPITVSGPV